VLQAKDSSWKGGEKQTTLKISMIRPDPSTPSGTAGWARRKERGLGKKEVGNVPLSGGGSFCGEKCMGGSGVVVRKGWTWAWSHRGKSRGVVFESPCPNTLVLPPCVGEGEGGHRKRLVVRATERLIKDIPSAPHRVGRRKVWVGVLVRKKGSCKPCQGCHTTR